MRWLVALALAAVFLLLTVAGAWLYFETGLKQYLRTRAEIGRIAEEQTRREALEEFGWYAPGQLYGGMLAGEFFGRVWVWGVKGLRSFAVDEYSVYSRFDGCSPEVLKRLNEADWEAGEARPGEIIRREMDTDLGAFLGKAKAGEYVRVYLAMPEMGGRAGRLRELYAYNFWLFMPWGMEARCGR